MGVSVLLSRGLVGTTDVTVRAGQVGTVGSSQLSEAAGRGRAGTRSKGGAGGGGDAGEGSVPEGSPFPALM